MRSYLTLKSKELFIFSLLFIYQKMCGFTDSKSCMHICRHLDFVNSTIEPMVLHALPTEEESSTEKVSDQTRGVVHLGQN